MISHQSPISGVSVYKDKFVATAGYDNKIILWDAAKKESISCGLHDHLVNQCIFSPCGNFLASSSSDYTARIWSIPDMRLKSVLVGHEDDVEGIAFHEIYPLIATTSRDHKIRLFKTSGELVKVYNGHSQDVLSVEWLNHEEIVTSSDDGTIKFWNIKTADIINDLDMDKVETDTIVVVDSQIIIAGNDDGEIIIFNNGIEIQRIKAHKSGVKRLCYNSAKKLLISSSYDRYFKLWQIQDSKKLTEILAESIPSIIWPRSCAFLGEDRIVFSTFGSSYAEYNYLSKSWNLKNIYNTGGINSVISDGKDIYTVGDSGIVQKNGMEIIHLPSLCNFFANCEGLILTGGQSGEIFNACTGVTLYQHNSPLNCATFFRRDHKSFVVFGTYTGQGLIFEKVQNEMVFIASIRLGDNAIKGVAASENYIFSVCAAGSAYFYSIETFQLVKHIQHAHDKIANGCAFLKDDTFVSISRDLTLRLTSLDDQVTIQTPIKIRLNQLLSAITMII